MRAPFEHRDKSKYKNVSTLQSVAIIRQRLHSAVQEYTGSPRDMSVSQSLYTFTPNSLACIP